VGCIGDETILEFAAGGLRADARTHVRTHLGECDGCRERVSVAAQLGASTGTTLLGRYQLERLCGVGGGGSVWAAFDERLNRRVALKRMHAEQAAGNRLLREARAMAQLDHPHVVRVYEVYDHGSELVLAMELSNGTTLRQWVEGGAPARRVLAALVAAGRGLVAAHAAGIVHRDFKPDNVLVADDGAVRVGDFGLAGAAPASPGETVSSGGGTPAYMAPEQLRGEPPSLASDQYAFAATAYEMLGGVRPYGGTTLAELSAAVSSGRPAAPVRRIAPGVRRVLARGLAAAPADRYPGLGALIDALDRAAERPRRVLLAAAGLTALVACVLAGHALSRHQRRLACKPALAPAQTMWLGGARSALVDAFARSDRRTATAAARTTTLAIDAYVAHWRQLRGGVCEGTLHGLSPALTEPAAACLDEKIEAAAALVRVLTAGDATALRRAPSAAQSLPDLDLCVMPAVLARRSAPPPPGSAAAVAHLRQEVARGQALMVTGAIRQAKALAASLTAPADATAYLPVRGATRYLLGRAEVHLGEREPGRKDLEWALGAAHAGEDRELAARILITMIETLGNKGGPSREGQTWAAYADAIIERLGRPRQLEALRLDAMGVLASADGDDESARRWFERSVALIRSEPGEHTVLLIRPLEAMARSWINQGQPSRAVGLERQALEMTEHALGPSHPLVGYVLDNLGYALLQAGKPQEARPVLTRALATLELATDRKSPILVSVLGNLARTAIQDGNPGAALPYVERAQDLLARAGEADRTQAAEIWDVAAHAWSKLKQPARAAVNNRRALAIYERERGPQHVLVALAASQLGFALAEQELFGRALPYHERARPILRRVLGDAAFDTLVNDVGLGEALLALGRRQEARTLLAQAVRGLEHLENGKEELARGRAALARADGAGEHGPRGHRQARRMP
jgi:tetratricopeptide (TPR) repeat protein